MPAYPNKAYARTNPTDAAANRPAPGQRMENPQPPHELDDEAQAVWDRLAPALADAGALVPTDLTLFAVLCAEAALAERYRLQEARLLDAGTITEHNRSGKPYEVEAAGSSRMKRIRTAKEKATKVVLRLADSFGLTPKSRLSMGLMDAQGTSLVAALHQMAEDATAEDGDA